MADFQFQFEKLNAWKESRQLVKVVYQLLEKFPKHEQYALCDQLRRAVISVPSNIAEGNSRISSKEQVHFFEIAFGSLMEVYCQMLLAFDLEYITTEDLGSVKTLIYRTSKLISGLCASKKSSDTIH